ncbi:MAG: hypothetical protein U1E69_01170, partial [Tabrizicola sp.]
MAGQRHADIGPPLRHGLKPGARQDKAGGRLGCRRMAERGSPSMRDISPRMSRGPRVRSTISRPRALARTSRMRPARMANIWS